MSKIPRLPDDAHPHPRERRYFLEQLCQRWNMPVSDLQDCIRRCEFRRVVCVEEDKPHRRLNHYYLDLDTWPFKDKEGTSFFYNSGTMLEYFRLFEAKYLIAGFILPHPQEVWIPEDEVLRFEEINNLMPHLQEAPLEAQTWDWIKAPELRIAVEAYHWLYIKGHLLPRIKHPPQIEEWLKKHHSHLSTNALERITTVVNEHKGGNLKSKYS